MNFAIIGKVKNDHSIVNSWNSSAWYMWIKYIFAVVFTEILASVFMKLLDKIKKNNNWYFIKTNFYSSLSMERIEVLSKFLVFLITLAGFPTTILSFSTSFNTIVPAPMTAPL